MIPEAGQRFGPYEILGRLGGGGMGLVFRAWDARLHREVAVKLLHDDYKMPGMRERFLQEARAASALNHPNICTIFDIGDADGAPYLVMELLQGETLKDRIARGALDGEDIVRYGHEIADALTAATVKGIVHRDIKPANIFLVNMPNGKSQAKVLDFGLAKIGLSAGGGWGSRTLDLTLVGVTVGTLAYMSPEQGRGEALDARSDLFSLGIVMYEMATRQVPFKGTTSAQMFVQLFNHNPEPVRDWNESIPRDLEKVILKLLAKDRRERFQTAKELQEALGRIALRRSKGGWLRKEAAAVPLVRALDPVARQKPPARKPSGGQGEVSIEASAAGDTMPPILSRDDRPVWPGTRTPARERGGGEGAVLRAANQGGVAESDSATEKIAAKSAADDAEEVGQERELAMLQQRSESGANQFEYGLDDLDLYGFFEPAVAEEVESLLVQRRRERMRMRVAIAAVAVVAAVGGIVLLARSGHFRPVVLGPHDGLLLTVIQNKTADKTLDGTVMQGMEIELRQSDSMKVLGSDAYRAGLQQITAESGAAAATVSAQRVAEKIGAKAYLYGEIKGAEAPYTISVDVLNANSNDMVASLEETAEKREEIPATISRLALEVRAAVSEGGRKRTQGSVPLEDDATANIDALHAYSLGEAAMQSGHESDALLAYQQAASLDPKFVQAQMRLAWLYRAEKAELAAESAARLANAGAIHASDKVKLLAQFCYEINVSGHYGRAMSTIRQYVAHYPRDVEGLTELARISRLQGNLPEALLAAQQAYGEDPFHAAAYTEAQLALMGMERYDGALQLETQARRAGVAAAQYTLPIAYLDGKDDAVAAQVSALDSATQSGGVAGNAQGPDAQLEQYALYLDNTGQLDKGATVWRKAAAKAESVPQLASAQAYFLAQAALDRALVESCTAALELAAEVKDLERGPVASFNAGMAAALCGDKPYAEKVADELQQRFPQNTVVTQDYIPELDAAADIGVNESSKALHGMIGTGGYEQASLAPYLRGLAHAAVGQRPVAIVEFQGVLAHRGAALTMGSDVYPMAEIGLARAAAASGNKDDSVAAYQRFLALWAAADQRDPLVKEALAKSR